jgi:hypothetical protein
MVYYAIEPPTLWGNIKGKPYITVSAKGIVNGLSDIPNDGADFGPDTMLGATSPNQIGPPYTQTSGIQEAINYAKQGTTVIITGGLYNISVPINIFGKYDISIEGRDQPLLYDTSSGMEGIFVLTGEIYNLIIDGIYFFANTNTTANIVLAGDTTYSDLGGNTGMNVWIKNVFLVGGEYGIIINPSNNSNVYWVGTRLENVSDNDPPVNLYGLTNHPQASKATLAAYLQGGNTLRISNCSFNSGAYIINWYTLINNSLIKGLHGMGYLYMSNCYIYGPQTPYLINLNTFNGWEYALYWNGFLYGYGLNIDTTNMTGTNIAIIGNNLNDMAVVSVFGLTVWISNTPSEVGIFGIYYYDSTATGGTDIIDIENIQIYSSGSAPIYAFVNIPPSSVLNTYNIYFKVANISPANSVKQNYSPYTATPPVPASGTAVTNTYLFPVKVYINGGAITQIQITIGGTTYTVYSNSTASAVYENFTLPVGASITLTYSTAPTWTWVPEL